MAGRRIWNRLGVRTRGWVFFRSIGEQIDIVINSNPLDRACLEPSDASKLADRMISRATAVTGLDVGESGCRRRLTFLQVRSVKVISGTGKAPTTTMGLWPFALQVSNQRNHKKNRPSASRPWPCKHTQKSRRRGGAG